MDQTQRIWDIIEKTGVGMLATRFAGGMRARPLDARPHRQAQTIYFIIDARGFKDEEIAACPDVCFTLINAEEKAYLSLSGRADILQDAALAAAFWKKADEVWWAEGPHDRHVRVLRLKPHLAELWDGPASSAVARYELAKSRATGKEPDLGENRKVTVRM